MMGSVDIYNQTKGENDMARKKDDSRFTHGFEDLKEIASTNFDRHMEAATKKIMGEVYGNEKLAQEGQRQLEVADRTGDGLYKIHHDGKYVDPNELHDAALATNTAVQGLFTAREAISKNKEKPESNRSR
jgi:hypothetical protein